MRTAMSLCLPRLFCLLSVAMAIYTSEHPVIAAGAPEATAATSPTAQASGPINWQSVDPGSPIPHQMPVADADTALGAGFAPQWVERSVQPWPPSIQDPDLPAKLILRIAKGERRPDDRWAHEAANELRTTLRTNGNPDVLRYARVFCGSQGCLCYFETPLDSTSLESFERARGDLLHGLLDDNGWGRSLGITAPDVDEVAEMGVWELIYILRPKSKG